MTTHKLYSIGYATKPIEVFIGHLRQYDISAVADVRSVPYSRAFYDYNRETLEATLKAASVHYVFLGDELGPRSKNDAHYDEFGQVQFDRLMRSILFLNGIERVQTGIEKGMCIALMCAEKDPVDCHRSLLIAYHLQRQCGIAVQHIRHDGELESQAALEARLVNLHNAGGDLFSTPEELVELAWQKQVRLKAYRRPPDLK